MQDKEPIIISLGGSMVVPDLPDPLFIIKFRELVLKWINNNKRFFIIVGGGRVCRNYQEALKKSTETNKEDLDWMGIYSTQLNAQLMRLSFKGHTPDDIVIDPSVVPSLSESVVFGAGWKPGCSTDMDAVFTAEEINAKKIINLSNVDYIYDDDPKINPKANRLENLSWQQYRGIIPSDWTPGMNTPFDPVASRRAEELGIEVAFISGSNLDSLDNYLKGEPFMGSTIK